MKNTEKLTLGSFLLLVMAIATLMLQLSKAWRNERDAQRELEKYETERRAIESVGVDPTNKVRHYMLSAKCDKGIEFISELNQILEFRKTQQ